MNFVTETFTFGISEKITQYIRVIHCQKPQSIMEDSLVEVELPVFPLILAKPCCTRPQWTMLSTNSMLHHTMEHQVLNKITWQTLK